MYSGIYRITFPNGKIYIGLSCDIQRRLKEHNSSAFSNLADDRNLPVHKAIKKYGKAVLNINTDILEEIDSSNRALLQEREQFWISYYNSNNKEKGYNLTIGGDGSASGVNNLQAKFNEQQLKEIYSLLINNPEIYIYDIAKQYSISPEAISEINTGKRYFNSLLTYPLRKSTKFQKGHKQEIGINHPMSKFSKKDIEEIYDMLINKIELSLQDIANNKQVCCETISKINRGLRYQREGFTYPLRKTKSPGKRALKDEQIKAIYDLLLNSDLKMKEIAEEVKCSYDSVKRINKGKTHKKDGYFYPLRNN